MSAFIFVPRHASAAVPQLRTRLEEVDIHFDSSTSLPEGVLLFRQNHHTPGQDAFAFDADTFVKVTGTFFFEGDFGKSALRAFLESFDERRPSLEGTEGQFCLIVRKGRKLFLFTDSLGMNKLYCDGERKLFSSLFLGIAESLSRPTIDPLGCYQYAWAGVTMGERTFYEQVRTLKPGQYAEAGDNVTIGGMPLPNLREDSPVFRSVDELVEIHVSRARALFGMYVRHFPDRINLSMSGGYDSRLMLALFLEAGVRPHLFSYGSESDLAGDAPVAREIASKEGLSFECIDKEKALIVPPEEYLADFMKTFGHFDGWRNDGIFDTGADRADRAARVGGGRVKVNGSAGEIYRNFFYLRSRPIHARELVWSFFSRYDPRACTSVFSARDYERELAGLIRDDVGASRNVLQRYQAELAYPLVRVRYWTARDVQLNQGFGLALFPFLEAQVIKGTSDLPVSLKSYGIFEGRMVRKINARLAAYPSDYGFDISKDPPARYRLRSQLTYNRSPIIRRYTYRLQFRRPRPKPYFMTPEYLRAVIDPEMPFMRRFFHLEALHDPEVFNRVATMQFHCERHGATGY